ncbi:MAG: hypothetical protein Q4Q53_02755 [Methanocorpusculum sp.]|nr:hypothetical protein [Methanocorpusculum sp.]
MATKKIKRIGIFSAGIMTGGISLLAGIITAIIACIGALSGNILFPEFAFMVDTGLAGSLIGILVAAIVGMIAGFISGALVAIFYNILAKMFGGLSFDLEDD